MKSSKFLLGILAFILALSIANASVYDIKMDIYPSNPENDELVLNEDEEFLVFGYIYINDDTQALKTSELKIQVLDDEGNLVATYSPTYIGPSDDYVFDGYFYKTIDISDEGEYVVRVKIGDLAKEFKVVKVEDMGDKELQLNLLDYSINNNILKIGIRIENKDTQNHEVKIYLKGEKNFENPETVKIEVPANDVKTKEVELPVDEFGESNFLIAAQAYSDGLISNPSYLSVSGLKEDKTYHKEDIEIVDVSLEKSTIFPGEIVEGTALIKNKGTSLVQYQFEYIYDNNVFKKGHTSYVQPGETKEEKFLLEIPDKSNIEVTFKAYNELTYYELKKSFIISQREKNFLFSINKYNDEINAGESKEYKIKIYNIGNMDDVYKISTNGWKHVKINSTLVSLNASKSIEIPLILTVPNETRVGGYQLNVTVCNTENKCVAKTLNFNVLKPEEEQVLISWDIQPEVNFSNLEPIEFKFNITNIGAEQKTYTIEIVPEAGLNYTMENETITLDVDETKEITFNLIPTNETNYTAFVVISVNGEDVFTKEITLTYKEEENEFGITGMFITEVKDVYVPGLIALAIIGIAVLIYFGYKHFSQIVWREKVLEYTRKHPQDLTRYRNTY